MIGGNSSTLSLLAEIIEIRKREGYEGYLLNYTILSGICLSNVKSLF